MIIVVMGVSGAGKSTVGQMLAEQLGWEFIDGDRFHPKANIEKMKSGLALTEADREPWLDRLEGLITEKSDRIVIAASALRRAYRDRLRSTGSNIQFVYLRGDQKQIRARLEQREDHFFSADLLDTQFATLEEPRAAITFDVAWTPDEIVQELLEKLDP